MPKKPSQYAELVRRQTANQQSSSITNPEEELDKLITNMELAKDKEVVPEEDPKVDPLQQLRELTLNEFIPIFVELVEKYSKTGISLQMDASNLLQGGREIRFDFGVGEHRVQLLGTATTEAIAFHETRFNPDVHGELVSGPMLRLRNLTGEVFRDFICTRLAVVIRASMRKR